MRFKIKKMLLLSAKIGLGVSVAIYIAQLMKLENAASAGTITLLTLITTRWDTFRLSLKRLIMFAVSVCLCWGIFSVVNGYLSVCFEKGHYKTSFSLEK